MIVHVLRFRFKDGSAEADVAACLEALEKVGRMESVSFAAIGRYTGSSADEYTHSSAYALPDIDAYYRYMHDPVHREADFIVHPHTTNFDAFDILAEDDPDLASEMAEIQQRRVAGDPELTKMINSQREH